MVDDDVLDRAAGVPELQAELILDSRDDRRRIVEHGPAGHTGCAGQPGEAGAARRTDRRCRAPRRAADRQRGQHALRRERQLDVELAGKTCPIDDLPAGRAPDEHGQRLRRHTTPPQRHGHTAAPRRLHVRGHRAERLLTRSAEDDRPQGARFGVLLSLISGASTLGLLFYGAYLVLQSTWTLGSMMAFNALALGLLMPLSSLMSAALRLQMLEVYLERLNDVWDTPPEQHGVDVLPAGALRGAIELDGVSFTYRRDSPWVLRNISLRILHGSRIAIVGRTGSGKSSLARLIAGLYEPTSGRILLDGVDLSGTERGSVRRQFGIVTKDAQLFGGSIRHNIAFADSDVGLDRVMRAAKLACLHDEIMSVPLKYETLLADRGLSLSGGQRQRLSIARALARDPKILVLAEATSHLDAVMERMVNRSVATLRCTTIVIAHRLTTVQDVDLIVVLDKGRIVELGRHHELMRQRARYAELARAQMNLPRIT